MILTNEPVPQVGTEAPDFTLPSTSGESVTLSALRGRPVLIAFFPLAFTSTCTAELCSFRDDFDRFATHDLQILPISVDSLATLKVFKEQHSMRVDLLSDFKREVGERYGVIWPATGYTNRAYFLAGRDGVLRWVHVEDHPGGVRSDEEILAQVAKLS